MPFFFSLLYQTTSLPLRLQQPNSFPNIYNNPARQNKENEEKNNHPTTKLSTTTKHRNLAPPNQHQHKLCEQLIIHHKFSQNQHKINPKSTEKQLENPTLKSRQIHWKTQLKINQNSLRNPIQKQSKPTGKPIPNHTQGKTHVKSPTKPDLQPDLLPMLPPDLLPPNLLPSGLPLLLPPNLPRFTVVCECIGLGYERGRELR